MSPLIKKIVEKYKNKPDGIRNVTVLRGICIACGSTNVRPKSNAQRYYKVCQDCNNEWYANHCWNCGEKVDSRDPLNVKCTVCGWLKCTCGACNINGCSSNPYNKHSKVIDNKSYSNIESFYDEIDEFDFTEGGDSGFEECEHGTIRKYCAYCND